MLTKLSDYIRIALYVTLIILSAVLFQAFEKEHVKSVATNSSTQMETTSNNYVPAINSSHSSTGAPLIENTPVTTSADHTVIHITTDVVRVDINPVGGNIVQVSLLNYPEALHSKEPFLLLNDFPDTRYLAQSGLLSATGPDTTKGQAVYSTDQTDYVLSPDQNELQIKLHWQNAEGVKITKIFTFQRDNYEIAVSYRIENQSAQPWNGNLYLQLMRKNTPPPSTQGFVSFATYFGAAISSPQKQFQKVTFKEMLQKNISQKITGGWAAMVQHYFVSAWVPDKNMPADYFSRVMPDGLYVIGTIGPSINVLPGQSIETSAKFYAGPSITDRLEKVAPGLNLTIDYGLFWPISILLFWMMQHIYNVLGNWGWSIVIVTLLIKLAFYHLSAKSYRSMSAMKNLQPRITALKERYGDDKQKFTQETLALYKKEKVNPMSGCLPILVQIPVFIGLYWVLIESVQLRQAPFIFWIHDLSIKDPYYILPLLMGLSMFLQQRLNPPPPDPMQAKIMLFMPVVFTVMFVNFPSGLMLYWFVNNTLSFLQQWFIMHRMTKAEKAEKARKNK
ncbi:MAG TPA: membrane protein insertase YidC [Gammaproteobacteria bacterium]|nr:membrane protein insertase YidC [Gammaproteobacteria bacterium]